MHAKYQVAIFNFAKVIANVKVGANQQTNQQTGQKQYVPHYYSGGHKKMMNVGKDYAEKICKILKNSFWKDVLTCYIMYISKKVVCKCKDNTKHAFIL